MSYADVNGISLYYEEHGSGQPLILLHGGYATSETYAAILPMLARGRRVIAVDLQGHGRTPDLDRRLVIVSHPVRHDGWFPQSLAGFDQMGPAFAEAMKQSPIYEAYSRVAPRVEDWPVLVDKMGTLLRQDYDWSAEVEKITAPVMLVYGDADSVRPAHIAEFYALLGGGLRDANWDGSARPVTRLAILPGHTHYDIFFSPDLPHAVIPFLDA